MQCLLIFFNLVIIHGCLRLKLDLWCFLILVCSLVTLTLQEGAHVPVQWEWQRGESIHDPTQPALP